jgi:DUF218 domain-containing protein
VTWKTPSVREPLDIAWNYMRLVHPPVASAAIIALGSFDPVVAIHAAALWKAGLAPVIIMSGGIHFRAGLPGYEQRQTEAEVFADIAISEGVDARAIILENKSRNTGENFQFSKDVFAFSGLDGSRILVVAKPYMTRRGFATGRSIWPMMEIRMQCESCECEAYFARQPDPEFLLHALVGDLHRIIVYPRLGFQAEQVVPIEVIEALQSLVSQGYGSRLVPGQPVRALSARVQPG